MRALIEHRLRLVLTAIAAVVALTIAPMAATAAPEDANHASPGSEGELSSATSVSSEDAESAAEVELIQREVSAISAYVSDDLELDYDSAAQDSKIREQTLNDFAAGLVVGDGEIIATQEVVSAVQDRADNFADEFATNGVAKASCGGRNGYRNWYPTVFLDSCASGVLAGAMTSGAGVSVIAGLLMSSTGAGPVVAGAIAGALGIYAGLFSICNSWGQGIGIYVNPLGAPICWSQ